MAEYIETVRKNDPNFYGDFYSVVNQVVDDTGVAYYDYAFDERFSSNYSWFMNSDHLNKEGAKQFVNILMKEIIYQ